jgi:hypothetical protein
MEEEMNRIKHQKPIQNISMAGKDIILDIIFKGFNRFS